MSVEARAYNGGFAFRYLVPQQDAIQQLQLKKEDTEFRLSTDATDWLLALPNYRSSYESEYVQLPTSALSNQGGVSSHFPHRAAAADPRARRGVDGHCGSRS